MVRQKQILVDLQYYRQNNNTRMSEKTIFVSIDMRNARYQGATKSNRPNGVGFLFNLQHKLIFSTWKNDEPSGPSLLIYPNRNYLYGNIVRRQLEGLSVYQKSNGETYYFISANGTVEKMVRDENNGIVTLLVPVQGKLQNQRSQKTVEANKWGVIGNMLGEQLPLKMKGVRNFIKENFLKSYGDIMQLSQSSGLTFFGYKKISSLGVKFDRKDRVTQVGIFQLIPQNIQFGRKYIIDQGKESKIQQGRFLKPEKLLKYEKKRPVEAVRLTQQYFKSGTNFQNIFFKTSTLEQIDYHLNDIQNRIGQLSMLQYGQKILQRQQMQEQQIYANKEYSLEEVQRDILAKVDKKNHTGRSSKKVANDWERQNWFTPGKTSQRHMAADNSSEKRQLSSQRRKRNHEKYLYTEILKDEMGESPYYRIDKQPNPHQFTLQAQSSSSPRKKQIYKPDTNRYNYKNTNRNISPNKTYGNQYKKLHNYSNNTEQRDKYSYFQNSDKSRQGNRYQPESFAPRNSYKYQGDESASMDNYLKYKNRNKTPDRNIYQVKKEIHFPKKYDIYQQKTPVQDLETPPSSHQKQQRQNNRGESGSSPAVSPIRRKNYKYL